MPRCRILRLGGNPINSLGNGIVERPLMAAVCYKIAETPVPEQAIAPEAMSMLNYLRFTSIGCRAKRKTDLFHACALLHGNFEATKEAYAEALMRCLNEVVGKRSRLHAPGTAELSFDEQWLVQLGLAAARNDDVSMTFLLRSRVAEEHRRLVRFLMTKISEYFSLI